MRGAGAILLPGRGAGGIGTAANAGEPGGDHARQPSLVEIAESCRLDDEEGRHVKPPRHEAHQHGRLAADTVGPAGVVHVVKALCRHCSSLLR